MYRWVVEFALGVVLVVQGFLWLSFAPVETGVQTALGVSRGSVRLLSLAIPFVFIFLGSYAGSLADRRGFKFSAGLGVTLLAVAATVRAVTINFTATGTVNYGVFMVAQLLAGFGTALAFVNISNLPAKWFPQEERALANGLLSVCYFLGTATALLLVPALAGISRETDAAQAISGLRRELVIIAAIAWVAFIIFFTLAREEPSARVALGEPSRSMRATRRVLLDVLLRSPTFVALCMWGLIDSGVYVAMTVASEKIITFHGVGFSTQFAALVASLMAAGGIVGSLVMPTASERLGLRRPFIVTISIAPVPTVLVIGLAASRSANILAALAFGFFCMSGLPMTTTILGEMEEVGPALVATATGVLAAVLSVGSVSLPLIMEAFARTSSNGLIDYRWSVIILAALAALGSFIVIRWVGETGPRRQAEKNSPGSTANSSRSSIERK
jgi:MFS family permease